MTFDAIIIGGGIAGVSLAFELARSHKVCLLETEERGALHATGRSAALFAPSYGGREIRAITRASRAFFDHPPPGFAGHALLKQRGCLYIARQDQTPRLEQMVRTLGASGGMLQEISREESFVHVPSLQRSYVAGAAFDADAADIEVDALYQGFLRGARAQGVQIRTRRAFLGAERQASGWHVEVAGEQLAAGVLVNAAGAWGDEVARACGISAVGLTPYRRTALLIDGPPAADVSAWPAVIDVDEEFYFKPDAGQQLLLSPADETADAPRDAYPDDLDVAVAVERVQAALAIDVQRVRRSWAGLRTFAADRVPVIGFDATAPDFFWCVGQGGYGIQTAPAMSRLAAALVRGEPIPRDVSDQGVSAADLSPARLQL